MSLKIFINQQASGLSYFKKGFLLLLIGLSLTVGCQRKAEIKGVIAQKGMVVTAHPLATRVGLEVIKQGGNAFDAAIAVQFALAVVLPKAGNIGGGGFLLYRKSNGEAGSLDFRETAPEKADRDMYLDQNGEPIRNLSIKGHLAAGVPGTVAGMQEIHRKLGVLSWERLLDPSIALAKKGFSLTEYQANLFNEFQEDFAAHNQKGIPFIKRTDFDSREIFRQPDLATTLERIKSQGAEGFYTGPTADLIVAEMERGGGIIGHKDLANYQPAWRDALVGNYRGHKVYAMPPSSSGGVALLQLLMGSEAYPIKEYGHNSAKSIHLMTELMRRVYADRATHLGDMDFFPVPLDSLLDPAYIQQRNANISLDTATLSTAIKAGQVERIESFQTTHFSIVDAEGNAASVTTTLNSYFGCKVLVKGAGFFLNNEMDDFSKKPGVANQFGLVGGEANAIAPGKRMLSSMTPTILEKNGELFMVLGTPGGSTIITNVYQTIINIIDHGMNMQQAVNAKKTHAQWLPDQIVLEEGSANKKVKKELVQMGHKLQEIPQIGRMEAILILPDGNLEGAADNTRTGDATALGW